MIAKLITAGVILILGGLAMAAVAEFFLWLSRGGGILVAEAWRVLRIRRALLKSKWNMWRARR